MDPDVAMAIDAESEVITWITRAAGTFDARGNGILGAQGSTQARAAVQPISGRELQDLPEGVRAEVTMVAWTRSSVAVDDEIVYRGDVYRVYAARPRPMDGFTRIAIGRVAP